MLTYEKIIEDMFKKELSGDGKRAWYTVTDKDGMEKKIKAIRTADLKKIIDGGPGKYKGRYHESPAVYETDGILLRIRFSDDDSNPDADMGTPLCIPTSVRTECIHVYDSDGEYLKTEYL